MIKTMSQITNSKEPLDLKDLFFSLMVQWKLIMLCTVLCIVATLLYLRTTPHIYSVDALVQVEETRGTSVALLGDLSKMIEQKQPAAPAPMMAIFIVLPVVYMQSY